MKTNFTIWILLFTSAIGIILSMSSCSKQRIICEVDTTTITKLLLINNFNVNDLIVFEDSLGNAEVFVVTEKNIPESYKYTAEAGFYSQGPDPSTECQWITNLKAVSSNDLLQIEFLARYSEAWPKEPKVGSRFSLSDNVLQGLVVLPTIEAPYDTLSIAIIEYYPNIILNNNSFSDIFMQRIDSANIVEIYVSPLVGIIAYLKANGELFTIVLN